jgi:monoamine oxidase
MPGVAIMYSTLAGATDADALHEGAFLFGQTHDDLLTMPISHESPILKDKTPHSVPISGLSNLMNGHYSESTESSVHYGDTHDMSEASIGHTSGRDDQVRSYTNGFLSGQDHDSHAPSPLHFPHQGQKPQSNGNLNGFDSSLHLNHNNGYIAAHVIAEPTSSGAALQARRKPIKSEVDNLNSMARTLENYNPKPKPHLTPELSQSRDSSTPQRSSPTKGKGAEFRVNSSIPAALSWGEFARQSILAAESSRLNPFSLHPDEYKLLRNHLTHAQVTIYLNIRNAILRLWTKNPLVNVTMEEAAGCAREKRYFNLAQVAYRWLMRNGYINFGCVEVPNTFDNLPKSKVKASSRRTIVVVGAGMSGLGTARHLEALSAQLGDQWASEGERPPKIIVLEARPRVGGRVYSHPLRDQSDSTLPQGHRCTAEMGAQIVTGFEHGNPMNAIIRGQLAIPYHGLRDNTILYDHDGTIVEKRQDILVEKLYNDVLERASVYRNKPSTFRIVEGDRNLILFGRDPSDTGGPTIATLENSNTPLPASANTTASTSEEKPSSGVEKLAGRAYQLSAGFNPNISAAEAAVNMGWQLKSDAFRTETLDLETIANSSQHPTLGQTMDDGIKQYQRMLDMKPKDLRLLNWHHANLEYANAVSVNQLSLGGWDQDIGNEFEGEHTQIIGGYQQVPRGLWQCPGKLDVRFKSVVKSIYYNTQERRIGKAVKVTCANGEMIEADRIVLTTPLGVLKSGSINFEPPLPDWKQDVIERMGFGLLNKVIMISRVFSLSFLTNRLGHTSIRKSFLGTS